MALRTAMEYGFDLLHYFGKEPLTEEMVSLAERFLVQCMSTKTRVTTFDELRYFNLSLSSLLHLLN